MVLWLSSCKARDASSAAEQRHKVPRSSGLLCFSGHSDSVRSRTWRRLWEDRAYEVPRTDACSVFTQPRRPSFLSGAMSGSKSLSPSPLLFVLFFSSRYWGSNLSSHSTKQHMPAPLPLFILDWCLTKLPRQALDV